jgi:hypothetical protein
MVPQHQNFIYCCFFAVAAVQSEKSRSSGAESDAEVSGIPVSQLASFAVDQDGRQVLEMMNPHRTSCFLEL